LIPRSQTASIVDNTRTIEILGLKTVKPWKDPVLDTLGALMANEKDWIEQGIDVEELLKKDKPSAWSVSHHHRSFSMPRRSDPHSTRLLEPTKIAVGVDISSTP
jgi:hypothetical protein